MTLSTAFTIRHIRGGSELEPTTQTYDYSTQIRIFCINKKLASILLNPWKPGNFMAPCPKDPIMRLLATALVAALASAPALAAPAYWTDWTSTSNLASAVIGDLTVGSTTVGVTYSGPYQLCPDLRGRELLGQQPGDLHQPERGQRADELPTSLPSMEAAPRPSPSPRACTTP
jgi:hypothetical protein